MPSPLEQKILGGGGSNWKKPSVGGVWIFSGTTHFRYMRALTFENYFIKAIEHFFDVYIASSKHSRAGRILESYANPRLRFA